MPPEFRPATPVGESPSPRPVTIVGGFDEIAARYDLLLCDVWGVLHDGLQAFEAAGEALSRFRRGGGRVILVSNAPRPGEAVAAQLDGFGVPRSAYDAVRTSGDLTREMVTERGGRPYHHIGPARDLGLFEGLEGRAAALSDADYVVCTGLFDDEIETIEDYGPALAAMRARDLLMICANPDLVVERGDRLILCAGALAAAYEAEGGRALTHGKPHPPIYRSALAIGRDLLGRTPDPRRVLAVGDAIRTDVAGGHGAGLDTLLVGRGIHAAELGIGGAAEAPLSAAWAERQAFRPTYLTRDLTWSRAG